MWSGVVTHRRASKPAGGSRRPQTGGIEMRGSNLLWTVVAVLAIIALAIYIF